MAKARSNSRVARLALLGEDTLLGKELTEVITARKEGAVITPYSASGEGGFGEQEGEAVYINPLDAQSIERDDAILAAGSTEGAQKAYSLVKAAGGHPKIIDCVGHLENQPEARIVAPLLAASVESGTWLVVVAHPAASALALVLKRLARYRPMRQVIANILEPASERGKRGVSELHQQTASLLAFKTLDKSVFDAQLSFNLLSQYGEQAPEKLSAVEQRIERHVATILGNEVQGVPMPSLRLIQAPVFHGYSVSLWVEFETGLPVGRIGIVELGEALASAQIEVRGPNEEAPNNVGTASQSGLTVGDIRLDRNNARAAWFWVTADNIRLTADGAADLVGQLEAKKS